MSNSNSILLNIHYYKLKYYEQNYYLNNIQNYYNVIKNDIFELTQKKNKILIILNQLIMIKIILHSYSKII